MNIKNGDMPAMPIFGSNGNPSKMNGDEQTLGLTKREQFAMAAMQGMLANKYVQDFNGGESPNQPYTLTLKAVRYADALLKALEA